MDIVKKLRTIDFTFWYSPYKPDEKFEPIEIGKIVHEAADEIEHYRKDNIRLKTQKMILFKALQNIRNTADAAIKEMG